MDGGIADLRDFRVTNSTEVLDVFRAAYAPVAGPPRALRYR